MHASTRIIETLYALDEPWRERFLVLTANLATGWRWDGRRAPGREEIVAWLSVDWMLRVHLMRLLIVWTGGGTRCLRTNDGSPS